MAHKSIRVEIMGRTYPLRVREEDEALTREIAAYVDGKMEAFRAQHSEQPPLTSAIITALALAEELYAVQRDKEQALNSVDANVQHLAEALEHALAASDAATEVDARGDGAVPPPSQEQPSTGSI